jgi:hypothetical protein
MYTEYKQGIFQSRLGTADYALVTSNLHINDRLVTWTVIHMTATKFKPLIFSVSGFALSNVANSFIFMILDDLCLLPALFCYVIIIVWYMKSLMHTANRCAPRKIASGAENLILQSAISMGDILPQIPKQVKCYRYCYIKKCCSRSGVKFTSALLGLQVTNLPLSMFFVELKSATNNKNILNVEYIHWGCKIWSWAQRDLDPKVTALAGSRSNWTSKLQIHPLLREGAPHQ